MEIAFVEKLFITYNNNDSNIFNYYLHNTKRDEALTDKQIIIVNILFQFLIYQKAEITVLNTHYLLVSCDELVTEYNQNYKQY